MKHLLTFLITISLSAGIFIWFEAEKEVRILCGMAETHQALDGIRTMLDTGNLLTYSETSKDIIGTSSYTLGTISCTITQKASGVTAAYEQSFRLEKLLGRIAASICLGMMIFQIALASGARFEKYAWGGFYEKLPQKMRNASGISAVIFLFFSWAALSVSGGVDESLNDQVAVWVVRVGVILFGLNIITNSISKSVSERKGYPSAFIFESEILFVRTCPHPPKK